MDSPIEIITDPEILHQVSMNITWKEIERLNLLKACRQASAQGWIKGCGVAAIQIGLPYRFAWFTCNKKEYTLVNPIIHECYGSETQEEGCLSIPKRYVTVPRPYYIVYESNGKKKRANGWMARIIQHEIDHMNGILITDKGLSERRKE